MRAPVLDKEGQALDAGPAFQGNLFQERATGLEPATSSLGSWHSTN